MEDRNLLAFWTTVAPMNVARALLAGATASTSPVLAIGGTQDGRTALGTVEAYNPQTDFWIFRAPLNTPRFALAAAVSLFPFDPSPRTLAFGGIDNTGTVSSRVEAFQPNLNTWTNVRSMIVPRAYLAGAAGRDGAVYAIDGTSDGTVAGATRTVQRYNTQTDTWTFAAPTITRRIGPAAATGPDGKIYVFGGQDQNGTLLSTVECYDPNLNTWKFVRSMPTARWIAAAVQAPNGRLLVIAGSTGTGNGAFTPTTNVVESYNPDTDTWSTVIPSGGSVPVSRSGLAAATAENGSVYAYGGFNSAGTAIRTNQRLQAFSGFAAPPAANPPVEVTVDPAPGMLTSATVAVSPLSGATTQWVDPSSRAGDNTAGRDGTDAVFAQGGDSLAADPVDTLFASGIGS